MQNKKKLKKEQSKEGEGEERRGGSSILPTLINTAARLTVTAGPGERSVKTYTAPVRLD